MTTGPRILIFTGDGKGKTTAALGMALRAVGHGMRVGIIQFVKRDAATGEVTALGKIPGVDLMQTGLGFLPPANDERFADHRRAAEAGLDRAGAAVQSGRYQLMILDEICLAVARGLLAEEAVIRMLEKADPESCLVLTGRGATAKLIERADTVTEMRCVKHGFQSGRPAQKGVEL